MDIGIRKKISLKLMTTTELLLIWLSGAILSGAEKSVMQAIIRMNRMLKKLWRILCRSPHHQTAVKIIGISA